MVSVGIVLGIRKQLSPFTKNLTGAKYYYANTFSSFWGCATSGFVNNLFIRKTELKKGVDVIDDEGVVRGQSKNAARKAVLQTAGSRFVLSTPIFIVPTIILTMEKCRLMPKNYYLNTLI